MLREPENHDTCGIQLVDRKASHHSGSRRMKIVALIPMRRGSRRIAFKHTKPLAGFPPALRAVNAALGAPTIDTVYVATNDSEIRRILRGKPVKFFNRSEDSATDSARTESVVSEFLADVKCDLCVLIQATNPFVNARHLKSAISLFKLHNADSLISGVQLNRYFYSQVGRTMISALNKDTWSRPGLKNVNGLFCENGAFYIFKRDLFQQRGEMLGGTLIGYEMPFESLIELDEPRDWELAESVLSRTNAVTQRNTAIPERS